MVGPYSLSYRGGEMSELLTTVDGRPLKEALANAERSKRIRAVLLVLPLFVFIFFSFL